MEAVHVLYPRAYFINPITNRQLSAQTSRVRGTKFHKPYQIKTPRGSDSFTRTNVKFHPVHHPTTTLCLSLYLSISLTRNQATIRGDRRSGDEENYTRRGTGGISRRRMSIKRRGRLTITETSTKARACTVSHSAGFITR